MAKFGWYNLLFALVLCCALSSCEKASAPVEVDDSPDPNAPLPGTIGAATYLEGLQTIPIQGYGLVAGLPGTGSSQCPERLRKDLMQTMAKYQKLYAPTEKKQIVSSSVIIDSKNTAVVRVRGFISPGELKGSHFELLVEALPNTATTSLEGGWLYTTDLRIQAGGLGKSVTSRILAEGSGPIFINPFERNKVRGTVILNRRGYVLNGGTNLKSRSLDLVLHQPSYGLARAIEQKINSIFGPPPDQPLWQTARAVSPAKIDLHIPPKYKKQRAYFIALVQNLYIRSDPTSANIRARQLAELIETPDANAAAISYAWEGMGKTVLPLLQTLYASSNIKTSFYSSRAGARIGDAPAIEKLTRFASDPKSPYRKEAIRTLGCCRSLSARRTLRKILDDTNIEMRILAYQGLLQYMDATIKPQFVGKDNFRLDMVKSRAWPLVYVTRTGLPKVVVFGDINLEPPVFYVHPDESITISASAGDTKLSLLRRTHSGKTSGEISASLNLGKLLVLLGSDPGVDKKTGKVTGLGLSYSHIVNILYKLCADGAIPAKFEMQNISPVIEQSKQQEGRPETND